MPFLVFSFPSIVAMKGAGESGVGVTQHNCGRRELHESALMGVAQPGGIGSCGPTGSIVSGRRANSGHETWVVDKTRSHCGRGGVELVYAWESEWRSQV